MIACVKWRVRSRRRYRVAGVGSVWRGNGRQGRRRGNKPFLRTLHSCGDEYAVHMYVKVAACNSQRLRSCARSRVGVWLCGFVCGLPVRAVAVRYGRGGLAHCYCVTIATSHVEGEQQQRRRRCCVAVACANLCNLPSAPAVGCPVAVFSKLFRCCRD